MLLVQQFLKNKTFAELASEHAVYASFSKSGHKFSLNYDQIEAKDDNLIVQECRGLILAHETGKSFLSEAKLISGKLNFDHIIPGNTIRLGFPFKRFYNYSQGAAANIDFNDPSLEILEKLDGTLCILYFDKFINTWSVATRSVPEADLPLDFGIYTFRTLFEKALKETTGYSFNDYVSNLDKEITYCFELTTPYNQVVVLYPNCGVTLLAARKDMHELHINDLNSFGVPKVKSYKYSSLPQLLEWVDSLNHQKKEGIIAEGVVVKNSKFERIKIKNGDYTAFSKIRDRVGSSIRNCLTLILSEKDDDVISLLPPEIAENISKMKENLKHFIIEHDKAFIEAKQEADKILPNDKKTFALVVAKKKYWTAPLFQMYDNKVSNMRDFISKQKKNGEWNNSFLDKILEHF